MIQDNQFFQLKKKESLSLQPGGVEKYVKTSSLKTSHFQVSETKTQKPSQHWELFCLWVTQTLCFLSDNE